MENKIKVLELFAGVGGFRIGLEKYNNFEVICSNQWEPSTKKQHASLVYEKQFGCENHINQDITTLKTEDIPDHDILVGGFPCQDYSVATTLHNSKGLIGKKGVLWWSIHKILKEKVNKPKYLFLENVDRLLKSPSTQRGRDYSVILKSLDDLGYAVEWRVINAADYGMPQKRKRIYIVGYHKSSDIYKRMKESNKIDWILDKGIIANSFPIENNINYDEFKLDGDLVEITNNFNKGGKLSPYLNSGIMINGIVYTTKTTSDYDGDKILLGDILEKTNINSEFYVNKDDIDRWKYLKGAKKEIRKSKTGYEYNYSEGKMSFPDSLEKASRTIITGEGGKSPSRFKHVIDTDKGLRRLLPIELERLNMFPDNHTKMDGISDTKRAFFMGNALVIGVVEKIGIELYKQINR